MIFNFQPESILTCPNNDEIYNIQHNNQNSILTVMNNVTNIGSLLKTIHYTSNIWVLTASM